MSKGRPRIDRNKTAANFALFNKLMGAKVAREPLTDADIAPYELVVLEAIECICKGIGNGMHWDRIAKAVSEAWIFANEKGIGEEAKPYIVVAKDGMERMKKRFEATGTMAFDGLALEAVRQAVALWTQQLRMATVAELVAAAEVVHKEFYRKEAA